MSKLSEKIKSMFKKALLFLGIGAASASIALGASNPKELNKDEENIKIAGPQTPGTPEVAEEENSKTDFVEKVGPISVKVVDDSSEVTTPSYQTEVDNFDEYFSKIEEKINSLKSPEEVSSCLKDIYMDIYKIELADAVAKGLIKKETIPNYDEIMSQKDGSNIRDDHVTEDYLIKLQRDRSSYPEGDSNNYFIFHGPYILETVNVLKNHGLSDYEFTDSPIDVYVMYLNGPIIDAATYDLEPVRSADQVANKNNFSLLINPEVANILKAGAELENNFNEENRKNFEDSTRSYYSGIYHSDISGEKNLVDPDAIIKERLEENKDKEEGR